MYLGRTLSALLNMAGKTQAELADAIGVRRPTVTALINDGTRPHPNNLGAICSWWSDPNHGTECLIAHLRDEISRAGMKQTMVSIQPTVTIPANTIEALKDAYARDATLRALLDDLAALVSAHA